MPFSLCRVLAALCLVMVMAGCGSTSVTTEGTPPPGGGATILSPSETSTSVLPTGTVSISAAVVREVALPLNANDNDYDALLALIGEAQFVLLGEATHGTREFYRERARITRRLIEEKGFAALAIEGDWPEAASVNQYVRGTGDASSAEEALSSFDSFPLWMWRNTDVRDLVVWLREHNDALPSGKQRVGFYGMDFFNRAGSAEQVVRYLDAIDKEAAERARMRYACLGPSANDPGGAGAGSNISASDCDKAVLEQLQELRQMEKAADAARHDPNRKEMLFSAVRNAAAIQGNREYDRAPSRGAGSSWNLRDRHMADTLDAIATHIGGVPAPGKVIAWAHNSHVGDARATEFSQDDTMSLGQMMRERYKDGVVLVGFSTYTGEVMAAPEWEGQGKVQQVPTARPDTYPGLFHEAGVGDFLLILRGNAALAQALDEPRPERGIGVVYTPEMTGSTGYSQSWLSRQYDALIHIDITTAVTPLQP